MSNTITINYEGVDNCAANIAGAAKYFAETPLTSCDTKTTICANGRGKLAYGNAQSVIALFGTCMEQEAANIRSLGVEFEEYDKLLAMLWEKEQDDAFFPDLK